MQRFITICTMWSAPPHQVRKQAIRLSISIVPRHTRALGTNLIDNNIRIIIFFRNKMGASQSVQRGRSPKRGRPPGTVKKTKTPQAARLRSPSRRSRSPKKRTKSPKKN